VCYDQQKQMNKVRINHKHIGSPKNTFNTTVKKMDCLDKIMAFIVLITVIILVCVSLVVSWEVFGQPFFLGVAFVHTHIFSSRRLDAKCSVALLVQGMGDSDPMCRFVARA
jgi:hypothetical protein